MKALSYVNNTLVPIMYKRIFKTKDCKYNFNPLETKCVRYLGSESGKEVVRKISMLYGKPFPLLNEQLNKNLIHS